MKFFLFFSAIISGLLSFNSYAKNSCPSVQVPFQFDLFLAHYVPSNSSHPEYGTIPALDIHGCTYVVTSFSCPDNVDPSRSGSFCTATSMVLLSDDGDTDSQVSEPDKDKPDTKPDENTDTKPGDSGGSVDDSSSGSSTPPPSEPEKPYPDDAGAIQLLQLHNSCLQQLSSLGTQVSDGVHNAVARNCNAILDRLSSLVPVNGIVSRSSDERDFITKTSSGVLVSCKPNLHLSNDPIYNIQGHSYPGSVVGGYISHSRLWDNTLNFNYSSDNGSASSLCNAVYQNKLESDSGSDTSSPDVVSPDTVSPGVTGGDTVSSGNVHSSGDSDNGDVVAAIDRFHADNNASHKQLLDDLKKKEDYSDTSNKVGDLFTNGISDFKSGAESSINSLIDSLEKYAPGLKGFGLPDGFYSNSGRCVPLDMSFTVSLPFYNYSAPVNLSTDKLCKFYDGYPRELLRLLIYMLTAFVLIVLLKQSLK
ncbi:hypothetical protein OOO55_001389 [Salmonella enterica]|nr:hypothetical protein [Salmonella enterica]